MLFRDRRITLVVIARFIARMGGEAAFFIGVWGMAAYRFRATSAQIALLMAVLSISTMIGSTISGVLVDRYGPRNVLVGAQIFYVPITLAVPMVGSLWQLVGVCSLFGLSTAPIMTATGSFAPYLAGDNEIKQVNALIDGAGAVSFVVGPGAGAVLAKLFGIESVFYFDAVLTTLGMLLVSRVATPPYPRDGEPKHPLAEAVEGLKTAYGMRAVRYYVLMGTLVWFSFGAFGALEPLFYRDVVKTGVETIGYMNSLFGVGIALGAVVLARLPRKATSARGLAYGVVLLGLGSILYIGTTSLVIIGVGSLVWGTVIGTVDPLLRTLMQLDSPEEYVGRVMGTAQLHRSAGEIVPLALAPALAALFGVQAVMIGGGVLASAIALATVTYAARIDAGSVRHAKRLVASEALATDDPISPIT